MAGRTMGPEGSPSLELLEWDSRFFGMSVARLTVADRDPGPIKRALLDLSSRGVRLVYLHSSQPLPEIEVQRLGGLFVDAKTTYVAEVSALEPSEPVLMDGVRPFSDTMRMDEIDEIAIQAGQFSRFFLDDRIPKAKAVELYRLWLARSLSREIADEVLVIPGDRRVVGLVTLGKNRGRGDIGLLAVDATARGKGHGRTLVRNAQRWFGSREFVLSQVVTQGTNRAACNLYSSCGYRIDSVEHVYHFWL